MPRAKQQDAAEAEGASAARAAEGTAPDSHKRAGDAGEVTAEFDGAPAKAARPGTAANGSAVKTAPKKAAVAAKVAPAKTATVPAKSATVKEKEAPAKAKGKQTPAGAATGKSTAAKGAEAKVAAPKEPKASEDKHQKVAPKPAKADGAQAKADGSPKADGAPVKSERATKAEPAAKVGHAAKAEPAVTTSESAKVGHVAKASSEAKVDAGTAVVEPGTVEAHKAEPVKAALPKPAAPAKVAPAPVLPEDDEPRAVFYERQKVLLLAERNNYTRQAEELRAQAAALALEHEPGDVQFDEEGGEGGTANVDRELDLHLSAQAVAAIEEIDAALDKIEAGTYGICESCGNPVPKARLEAIPHARLCVTCKSGGLSRRQ